METKTFELRDRGTFIPVVAINCNLANEADHYLNPSDYYLLRRAGYSTGFRCILFGRLEGGSNFEYDPFDWGDRTFQVAHNYITAHWDSLRSGEVIDVEFILNETQTIKVSEQYGG